jgi:hypothetical protein
LKIILQNRKIIAPYNEPARDLRIHNKHLWLLQRDMLAPYTTHEVELPAGARLPQTHAPCLVYRDNLCFDAPYMEAFIKEARRRKRPSRAAFSLSNPSFRSSK